MIVGLLEQNAEEIVVAALDDVGIPEGLQILLEAARAVRITDSANVKGTKAPAFELGD